MRDANGLKWFCTGMLVVACAVFMAACSDGDDDDESGDGTTVVVVTNAPDDDAVALVAPQLVSPADGTSYSTIIVIEPGYNVDFEWTAVPGAASYVLEVDGVQHAAAGTTLTLPMDLGDHEWRVWAKDADGASGPASGKDSFSINIMLLTPI